MDTYTPEEFAAAIKSGDIEHEGIVAGMAKAAERDGYISFSNTGCENWVDIPFSIIDKVELTGWTPCHDHRHPRVRITLQRPSTETEIALFRLVSHFGSRIFRPELEKAPASFRLHHGHSALTGLFTAGARQMTRKPVGYRNFGAYALRSGQYNCSAAYPDCVGGVDQCPYPHCACCDADGACYCSSCCLV